MDQWGWDVAHWVVWGPLQVWGPEFRNLNQYTKSGRVHLQSHCHGGETGGFLGFTRQPASPAWQAWGTKWEILSLNKSSHLLRSNTCLRCFSDLHIHMHTLDMQRVRLMLHAQDISSARWIWKFIFYRQIPQHFC